jgi:nitroreductase
VDFAEFKDQLLHQRAIREFDTSKPVDDSMIEQAIRIAQFAPNGGNRQPWRFMVIRDREIKRQLGKVFDELGAQMPGHGAPTRTPWEDVPVLVAVCSEIPPGAPSQGASPAAASIYPAVQNLLLAVQAQGLGSVLTTRWKAREPEMKAPLGLPDNIEMHAILPIGWPDRKYGRGKRIPLAEVTYRDKWGQPWLQSQIAQ